MARLKLGLGNVVLVCAALAACGGSNSDGSADKGGGAGSAGASSSSAGDDSSSAGTSSNPTANGGGSGAGGDSSGTGDDGILCPSDTKQETLREKCPQLVTCLQTYCKTAYDDSTSSEGPCRDYIECADRCNCNEDCLAACPHNEDCTNSGVVLGVCDFVSCLGVPCPAQ